MMNNGFISPLKFLSLSFCLTCLPSNTQAINIYPPIITSNQQQQNKQTESPEVGLEIIGSPSLNRLVIPMYRYTGECPGFSKGIVKASFTSTAFPPSRDRRVMVRNVSRGVASDPFPFTDRDYSRGRGSEITEITIGPGHDRLYLIVRQGENDFDYKIKEKNTIVDQGTFTAYVETTTIVEERNKVPTTKPVCGGNRIDAPWGIINLLGRIICDKEEVTDECPSYPDVTR
ncbi:hypothetical protein [Microcystis aeruginosa]|uniref:Similarity n=2 Tax=Microcystis aeruginosa (strain PCC 7806) TaxID=267872 RepID=A8YFS4_MICA7|nr:hypothetical protein [Microcystis aeruginosa]ARI82234.1 hypothetical protein BH695_2955 [Microcystis aeruginosa PCC 7806SL]TRU07818.1 MAG: hypothetical protein EWV61_00540 [Microcystis aeruginosa Ma_AC_P_19900807_S300]ELS46280.1 hypothetical protein C789_3937 [Microcystis aeruginosa FACHB-905 = DIANCHI905]UGS10840.1 hypothetical protein LRR78_09655 [Microcystis aeruginosa FACHB-905 = DIANCHI905]WKX61968.1 hypothetical protein Q3H53_001934 [Microcystis aeruginosa PCC 7806]